MKWTLEITGPPAAPAQTITLENGRVYTIGQAGDADVPLAHPVIASYHARLAVEDDRCILTDLGSVAGTLLDGQPLPANEPVPLPPGRVVEIALFHLEIKAAVPEEAAEEATAAAEEAKETVVEVAAATDEGQGAGNRPPTTPVPFSNGRANVPQHLQKLGFKGNHSRYVQHLPAIYDTPFMHRFLTIFESLLAPIVWRIDNLDLYLDPHTTPEAFLPWLARWYALTFDHTWSEKQRRQMLKFAPAIFGCWGTHFALTCVLTIYTRRRPQIVDDEVALSPFTFRVVIPLPEAKLDRDAVEKIINAHKPAHTAYELVFCGKTDD